MRAPRRGIAAASGAALRGLGLAITAVIVLACASVTPSGPATAATPIPTGAVSSAAVSSTPPTGASLRPQASIDGAAVVTVDPGLLGHLPGAIGAASVTPDTETAAEIGANAGLGDSIDRIAVGAAFGPIPSDAPTDYAVATVVHLRPGVFDDAWFRDWRDTFDTGVCGQAGGVDGHAEATIGGRPAFIGTCTGGVHTWHVHLPGPDVVVSIQGAGPQRFGERLLEGVTE